MYIDGAAATQSAWHIGRLLTKSSVGDVCTLQLGGCCAGPELTGDLNSTHTLEVCATKLRKMEDVRAKFVMTTLCSEATLISILGEGGLGLPNALVATLVDWLKIERVQMNSVSCTGCSSTRGDYPLSEVLTPHDSTWWISGARVTTPHGGGASSASASEWLEFDLGRVRRVTVLLVRIPPFPYGPLSVRTFNISFRDRNNNWIVDKQIYFTLDLPHLQELKLRDPLQTNAVRLHCRLTAHEARVALAPGTAWTIEDLASIDNSSRISRTEHPIGLFQVGFV